MVRSKVRPSSCHPIDNFAQGNAHVPYQPSDGPARTTPMPRGRSGPYERHRSPPGIYANAEAGPSTFAAPLDPHLELPPGGISEPTANAEQKQIITEEEETPVSDFYCSQSPSCNHTFIRRQAPRKTKRQRNDEWRGQSEDDFDKLRTWVRQRKNPTGRQTLDWSLAGKTISSFDKETAQVQVCPVCDPVAIGVIRRTREMKYLKPRLASQKVARTGKGGSSTEYKRQMRVVESWLYEEFSRCNPRPDDKPWFRPAMLVNVSTDVVSRARRLHSAHLDYPQCRRISRVSRNTLISRISQSSPTKCRNRTLLTSRIPQSYPM